MKWTNEEKGTFTKLGKKRWEGVAPEDRRAHARMMVEVREGRREVVKRKKSRAKKSSSVPDEGLPAGPAVQPEIPLTSSADPATQDLAPVASMPDLPTSTKSFKCSWCGKRDAKAGRGMITHPISKALGLWCERCVP